METGGQIRVFNNDLSSTIAAGGLIAIGFPSDGDPGEKPFDPCIGGIR